jgi:hypothetical protein
MVLKNCLAAHIDSKTICRHQILTVLKMLPISNKNSVLKLEDMVTRMSEANDFGEVTATIAKDLITCWSSLQLVYKIPKRERSLIENIKDVSCRSRNGDAHSQSIKRSKSEDSRRSLEKRSFNNTYNSPDWKPRHPVQILNLNLPPGWIQLLEDGKTVFRNHLTNEMSITVPFFPILPTAPVPIGSLHVTPGISADQLRNIILAAEESSKRLQLAKEASEIERKEKEKGRRERDSILRAEEKCKEKERKIRDREKKENDRILEKEKKIRKLKEREEKEKAKELGGKLNDILSPEKCSKVDKEKHTKDKKDMKTDEILLPIGWTALQLKSLKSQVKIPINSFQFSEIVIHQLSKHKGELSADKFKEFAKGVYYNLNNLRLRRVS